MTMNVVTPARNSVPTFVPRSLRWNKLSTLDCLLHSSEPSPRRSVGERPRRMLLRHLAPREGYLRALRPMRGDRQVSGAGRS